MKNTEAVIFDLDGVIIDSEPLHMQVNMDILDEFGAKISEKEHNKLVGFSSNETWGYLKERFHLPVSVEELKQKSSSDALTFLDQHQLKPIEGIPELIEKCEKYGMRLAVASSSERAYIEKVLKNFGLEDHFKVLVSGAELPRSKPDPTIFLKTAELLKVEPGKCLVIEDSFNGVTAAKSANMSCIGYRNSNSGNQDLLKADVIVDTISDIQKFLFT